MFIKLAMVGCISLICGCATMFQGSNANVSIRSEIPGAKIYLNEEYIGSGSASVSVRKKGNSHIRVVKEGCVDSTRAIGKQFDPTTLLGFFIDWGLISILVVDGLATGAIYDIEPKSYVVNPSCEVIGKADQ